MRALLLLLGVSLIVPGAAEAGRKHFDPAAVYAAPVGDAPGHGPDDALVTIIEWSDYRCRYCNRVQRSLEHLARLYDGEVRWVHRYLPLDDDETLAAEAALAAAAQGAFAPMHDRLFAVHGQVDRATVELIAGELGLDLVRFRADLDAGVHRAALARDVEDAVRLGVTGTPMFFVNGRPLRGAQPLGTFVEVIDQELARARAALADGAPRDGLYARLVGDGRTTADADAEPAYPQPYLDPSSVYRVGLGLDGHAAGPDTALVTVVTWSDFQCPYCAHLVPTLARLREEYGDRVRVVHRHMPLPNHPEAQLAAEAAVAAGAQGKFWAMHDRLFAAESLARADLERIAGELGLDLPRFRAALDERRHRDAVADDAAAGSALGVAGTPTLFVNGTPIEGAPRWEQLELVVEARLAEAESLVANGIAPRDVYGMIMATADGAERGDPSRMPRTEMAGRLELRQDDRADAVTAACRGRDAERAGKFAGRLDPSHRAAAAATCEAYGIELPTD